MLNSKARRFNLNALFLRRFGTGPGFQTCTSFETSILFQMEHYVNLHHRKTVAPP